MNLLNTFFNIPILIETFPLLLSGLLVTLQIGITSARIEALQSRGDVDDLVMKLLHRFLVELDGRAVRPPQTRQELRGFLGGVTRG